MKFCIPCEIRQARYLIIAFIALSSLLGLSHKAHAERIISIDGSLTEIIYALGSGDQLVGRDITSTYPAAAVKLPSVGYMRQLSAEGILSLNPTLVITTTDAKPQKVFDQLEGAGIKVVRLNNSFNVAGVYQKIEQVGQLLNKQAQAHTLIEQIKNQLSQVQKQVKEMAAANPQTAIFTMGMRNGNMMVAGSDTRADEMLRLAGMKNAPADLVKGYKPLTAEAAILYNPSYLITMQHAVKSSGGREKILNATAISLTEAGRQKNLVVLDNSFLTFGPRIGEAVLQLANQVYKAQP